MKKKDLLNLIKTKADDVEIKDLTKSILKDVSHLPMPQKVKQSRFSFKIGPLYLVALSAATAVLLFILFYQPISVIPPDVPNDFNLETYGDAVALSTISTTSLIDLAENELSSSGQTNQSLLLPSLKIVDELDDLIKYLELMEKLLSSEDDFKIRRETISEGIYDRLISFTTTDLLNQELTYQIQYNQVIQQENRFTLNGLIQVGDQRYQMTASGQLEQHNMLVYRLYTDENNYVEVDYQSDDNETIYLVRIVKNGTITETVQLHINDDVNEKTVNLSFLTGASMGSYQFVLDTDNETHFLSIAYQIDAPTPESGELHVRVILFAELGYQITVIPDIGLPFVVFRIRNFRLT